MDSDALRKALPLLITNKKALPILFTIEVGYLSLLLDRELRLVDNVMIGVSSPSYVAKLQKAYFCGALPRTTFIINNEVISGTDISLCCGCNKMMSCIHTNFRRSSAKGMVTLDLPVIEPYLHPVLKEFLGNAV